MKRISRGREYGQTPTTTRLSQVARAERLLEECLVLTQEPRFLEQLLADGSDVEHLRVGVLLSNPLDQLGTVHLRHEVINDIQIGAPASEERQRFRTVAGGLDAVSGSLSIRAIISRFDW